MFVTTPVDSFNRQIKLSIDDCLHQESKFEGRSIFVFLRKPAWTGRYYRNYACSVLHQNPTIHSTAILSGKSEAVADELRVYAMLQSERGAMDYHVGIDKAIAYFSFYTEAMFLRALYQYICLTGDRKILDEYIKNDERHKDDFFWYDNYKGFSGTVYEHGKACVNYLSRNLWNALVPPMDYHDGLPLRTKQQKVFLYYYGNNLGGTFRVNTVNELIDTKAACQGSMVWVAALREFAQLAEVKGDNKFADTCLSLAERIEKAIEKMFYNSPIGVYGTIIDNDGKPYGNTLKDFISYVQIWALATGFNHQEHLLENILKYRIRHGCIVYCDSLYSFETTNLRNVWPEQTNFFAIQMAKLGRADSAFKMVLMQLPENLHKINPEAPDNRYIEAYDSETLTPAGSEVCAGDAELVHYAVESLIGLEYNLNGITFNPKLPSDWKGKNVLTAQIILFEKFVNISISSREEDKKGSILNGRKIDKVIFTRSDFNLKTNDLKVIV